MCDCCVFACMHVCVNICMQEGTSVFAVCLHVCVCEYVCVCSQDSRMYMCVDRVFAFMCV